jgi:hypothetical protein
MSTDELASSEGLDPFLVRVFVGEMRGQIRSIYISLTRINEMFEPGGRTDSDAIWHELGAALNAMTVVANILWPGDKRSGAIKRRSLELRRVLGMKDSSAQQLRDVRNSLAHADEKIDDWHKSKPNAHLYSMIGPDDMVGGIAAQNFARRYNPLTKVVTVYGKSVDVQAAFYEIEEVSQRIEDLAAARSPYV